MYIRTYKLHIYIYISIFKFKQILYVAGHEMS